MSIFVKKFRIFFLSLKLHYTLSSCHVVFVVAKLEIVAWPALSNTIEKLSCHHDKNGKIVGSCRKQCVPILANFLAIFGK